MSGTRQAGTARLVRQVIIDLGVLAAIGIVLGFLAPLGTGFMPLGERIGYWVLLAVAGYAFYKPIGALVVRLGPVLDFPAWVMWTAAVFIASVPMAVLVWLVNTGGSAASLPPPEVALVHYLSVCVVGAVITLLFNLLPATGGEPATSASQPPAGTSEPVAAPEPAVGEPGNSGPAAPSARFLDRLPADLGSDLIALEMEDHYVRAHTALGSELVLMRMRDAVAELDGIAGEQVHRSWWVARGAVAGVKREGRNVRLVLDNGMEAPVSRANVGPLKDRGWF